MAGGGRAFCALFLSVLIVVTMHANSAQAVTCYDVLNKLVSCGSFLLKGGAKPAAGSPCCSGVQALNTMASTKQTRQAICSCFEKQAKAFSPNPAAVAALPGACGVPFPYSFNPNQDCSKIQ